MKSAPVCIIFLTTMATMKLEKSACVVVFAQDCPLLHALVHLGERCSLVLSGLNLHDPRKSPATGLTVSIALEQWQNSWSCLGFNCVAPCGVLCIVQNHRRRCSSLSQSRRARACEHGVQGCQKTSFITNASARFQLKLRREKNLTVK